jgi:hypothetical protein
MAQAGVRGTAWHDEIRYRTLMQNFFHVRPNDPRYESATGPMFRPTGLYFSDFYTC